MKIESRWQRNPENQENTKIGLTRNGEAGERSLGRGWEGEARNSGKRWEDWGKDLEDTWNEEAENGEGNGKIGGSQLLVL